MNKFTSAFVFLTLLCGASAAGGSSWNHNQEGRDWPASYPICADSPTSTQSPISISNAQLDPTLSALNFKGSACDAVTLVDNGHTWQVNFAASCNYYLALPDSDYKLLQFHVHTMSEHQISDNAYGMELHMVHANAAGQLAVVGVFIDTSSNASSAENAFLKTIWPGLATPAARASGGASQTLTVNPYADLVPANPSYFHYPGSLTTPPCSEGVKWFVMQEPVMGSQQQTTALYNALHHTRNHRVVQPLNGRVVKYFSGLSQMGWAPYAIPSWISSSSDAVMDLLRGY